jgi:valyl-tRNA synthetase
MSATTLSKTYEPKAIEEKWAAWWISSGLTVAGTAPGRPVFSMVIPPPNITGALHLGHALNSTLQDVLARYKRMKGFNVLWLPGIDHAGIATQNVVERRLAEEGTSRQALGREAFIGRVWRWKEESGSTIINQLKRLGATCDWTRLRFTMDEGLSRAVRTVFARLYDEGLIYRGDYIINWCPRCHTALSDLEVSSEEVDARLYHMEYPLKEPRAGFVSVTVATTRPETMLGDMAVAVNPDDERYAPIVGATLLLPLAGREIPVIADASVSREFGTGAVKVTPAHDFNDFEIASRHGLAPLRVMGPDARMNENAGRFEGLDRYEARRRVVEEMTGLGLLKKAEPHRLVLGSCYRCATPVEPALSRQWFVRAAPLAERAIEAVEEGRIRFVPRSWENTYFEWMRNIRDWCISRQIWWGHRIPAWHCGACGHVTVVSGEDPSACAACANPAIVQDGDVLDTWFSSALWPFSTLGWPDETEDLKLFYPTSVLSTSFDIIFFWVARMAMMGLKFMGTPPFKEVYIHALIRDAEGQKMSKSRGNVIDPLVMMERYGTDALRFTLAAMAAQGRDIRLAEERVAGYRNFCNKLWNLARFVMMNIAEGGEAPSPPPSLETLDGHALNAADRWVLTRLSICASEVSGALDHYEFDSTARSLYRFVWHELCDWYVELVKNDLKGSFGPERKAVASAVLFKAFGDALKMLHPFMPFITEEIFSYLPGSAGSVMSTAFPEPGPLYGPEAAEMDDVMDVVRAVRNIRTEMDVAKGARVGCVCRSADASMRAILERNRGYITALAGVGDLAVEGPGERPADAVSAIAGGREGRAPVEVYVPLAGLVDREAETKRLKKELDKVIIEYAGVNERLSNDAFVGRAPKEVVENERARQARLLEKKAKLEGELDRVRGALG